MFQICQCETSIFLAPEKNTLNRNYPSVKNALEEADVFNRSKLLFQQLKNKGIKVFRRSLQLFFIFGELLRLLLDNFLSLLHIADNAFQLLLHLSDFYVHRVGDDILDFIKILCRPPLILRFLRSQMWLFPRWFQRILELKYFPQMN